MDKLRLGVIGVGVIGKVHIENILAGRCPEIVLTAVASRNAENLAWAKERAPFAARFQSAREMADSGLIDAALIATPHCAHPEGADICFSRGLHVMTEKPAAVCALDARAMSLTAEKAGVIYAIMFNRRVDPVFGKMREIVQSGMLGDIRRTNWIATDWYRPQAYYDSGGWRATWRGEGGGVLLNQCPHNLDLLQWICGMPVSVEAKVHFGKWHAIEVEDDVSAYFEYANGATGVFITSTGDAPGTNRFEISLSGGKLLAENRRLTVTKLEVSEEEFSKICKEPFGKPKEHEYEAVSGQKQYSHAAVMNAFAAAVLRAGPLVARGEEGVNSLTLSNAMHLSAWTNSKITLPMDDAAFRGELAKRARRA
ncbi:MAG: Gfo/Idh/MocA family oxidoreductase [Oscillospiraceae bacterium]|jgi:predicted dehydrogenase|nr:Gfo/Idh/MocA family oxidoreductase [Oscillospiraceae bacterium]